MTPIYPEPIETNFPMHSDFDEEYGGLPTVGRADLFRRVRESWERAVPFDLRTVQLSESDLVEGRFFNLDLSRVIASGYRFAVPTYTGARALFPRVCFREADLDEAIFTHSRFQACSFRSASCRLADFRSTHFEANPPLGFLYANLSRADFSQATLEGADFREANAHGLVARQARLAFSDFRGANLRDADLTGADLTCCDFERATLYGTRFAGAHIDGCDFAGALLDGSDLERVLQMRQDGRAYVFVQWRHKDSSLPAPLPNFPYNDLYPAAPPALSEEKIAAAYEEYGRWLDDNGFPPASTGPDEDDSEGEGEGKPIYREVETQQGTSEDPFLPDFPDD